MDWPQTATELPRPTSTIRTFQCQGDRTGGTIAETSPSKAASSLIALERRTKYRGSVGMMKVSMAGSRPLFMMDSSNS
ncbi:MAG: hypothetical protein MZU97_07980 [Bacillus subtilis]|nr:hypothetical protein [Bacillus subtilis]